VAGFVFTKRTTEFSRGQSSLLRYSIQSG